MSTERKTVKTDPKTDPAGWGSLEADTARTLAETKRLESVTGLIDTVTMALAVVIVGGIVAGVMALWQAVAG